MENAVLVLLGIAIIALVGYLIWMVSKSDDNSKDDKTNVIIKTAPYPEDPYRYWNWASNWRRPLGWRRWHP